MLLFLEVISKVCLFFAEIKSTVTEQTETKQHKPGRDFQTQPTENFSLNFWLQTRKQTDQKDTWFRSIDVCFLFNKQN